MPTNITVIGSGNMGGALLHGWAKAARSGREELSLTATAHTNRSLEPLHNEFPEIKTSTANLDAVADADIIVVAVKPWLVEGVLAEIRPVLADSARHPLLVSVAAGISSEDLRQLLNLPIHCIYAMPNIAAEYGESMSFVEDSADVNYAPAPRHSLPFGCTTPTAAVRHLFELVGKVRVVPSRLMAPGTMMAGCGIAYVMRYVRAMMEGGVEMGFYPDDARAIALQTMQGAVELLEATGLHPEAAIDRVTTPGGITIRGLNELDHAGFSSAVIRSLKAGL